MVKISVEEGELGKGNLKISQLVFNLIQILELETLFGTSATQENWVFQVV